MKIALLSIMYPPDSGGAETYAYELSRALADRGHEVDVFTATTEPIADHDTMHDVYNKITQTSADIASDAIEQVQTGNVSAQSSPVAEGEYRSFPDAADQNEFYRRENRFR